MKSKKNFSMKLLISAWIFLFLCLSKEHCFAGALTTEQPGPYLSNMDKIKKDTKENKITNMINMILWKHLDKMEEDIRRAAQKMAQMKSLDRHVQKIKRGKGTLQYEKIKEDEDDSIYKKYEKSTTFPDVKRVELDPKYMTVLGDGSIIVTKQITEDIYYRPPASYEMKGASYGGKALFRNGALIRRVSSAENLSLANMVNEIGRSFFPKELFQRFDARGAAAILLRKAGVVPLAEGVVYRPSAPQDVAFAKFANLGNTDTEHILFWSDPIVLNGYHPVFGTTLNNAGLPGYKMIDMDDVASRGYSGGIERRNMLHSPEERIANPFRGYAAQVIPGLILMGKQGRLKAGQEPSDENLTEAMKLTKNLSMLPSQKMKLAATNPSAPQFSCLGKEKGRFNFVFPRPVLTTGGGTTTIFLPDLQRECFKRSMEMAKRRLIEIQLLMKANRQGRLYANEVIESYARVEDECRYVIDYIKGLQSSWSPNGWSPDGAIPQIAQLREDILSSIEHYRRLISKMEYWHDDLLQKEWIILEHILEKRREAIQELMDNGDIRYRMTKMGEKV